MGLMPQVLPAVLGCAILVLGLALGGTMVFRELLPEELKNLSEDFYKDVDSLNTGERYTANMAGSLIGAFDGDTLVGVWGVLLHVRCGPLWVVKERRGRSTEIRAGLWREVKKKTKSYGARFAFMFAMDGAPQVAHIISKLPHRELKGRAFLMEID